MNGKLHPEAAELQKKLAIDEAGGSLNCVQGETLLTQAGVTTLDMQVIDLGNMKDSANVESTTEYTVYTRRWFILALFVLYSASNAFQWTQLVIITSILEKYYSVSTLTVYWTSMIYMVVYIPLILPASWLLDKKGLRLGVLLGSAGTCIGSWLKVLATGPDQWWLAFLGQTVVAVSQIFILGIPAQLAATWFPPHQMSSATSIGVFGNQLGIALGFVLPAIVVHDQVDPEKFHLIGDDLFLMFIVVAIFTSVLFLTIVFGFKDQPPTPSNRAQDIKKNSEEESYLTSIKNLCTNPGYILLLITYGMNVGVFYAISTLLNTTVVSHFKYEGVTEDAGRIGLVIVCCGMAGSMMCGIILDKTHSYKATTLTVYFFSFVGMILYTFTFRFGHIEIVYFTSALLGFFMTGYLPLGFEFAAEITYPASEGTSSGLLNASAQVFGIFCTMFGEWLYRVTDDRIANSCLAGILLVGTVLTAVIKPDYRRQKALKKEDNLPPVSKE